MSDKLMLEINVDFDNKMKFCDFYKLLKKSVYNYYLYDETRNSYYIYSSNKSRNRIRHNIQIGKYIRTYYDEMLFLEIMDYNFGFDQELITFIEKFFPVINSYLEETEDYNVYIGLGRLFNGHTFENNSIIDISPALYVSQDIKRILTLLCLIRRINFGKELDEYSKVLTLHPVILKNIYNVIFNCNITIYHIKRLIDLYRIHTYDLPLLLENEELISKGSLNVIYQYPETKFCYWFKELINRRLQHTQIKELLNKGDLYESCR